MRDDGVDNASEVARRECHTQLRRLAVRLLERGEDVLLKQADDGLEEELRHHVWAGGIVRASLRDERARDVPGTT